MRVAVFSTKAYDRQFLSAANSLGGHELIFFEPRLTRETSPLAAGFEAVCAFVNDRLDADTLSELSRRGVRMVALRCAGFNQVDVAAADHLGLSVARVPAYSPHAVAEHTVGLILSLNRRLHKAYLRVREGNFALDGLLGFDLCGRVVGIVGTGQIGAVVARILAGFGCRLLAYDVVENGACRELGVRYVPLEELLAGSSIITLHCPLLPQTRYLIDERAIARMQPGAMLINTSRGGLIDTTAVIDGLKSGRIGNLGLDVYEEEADLFFENLSEQVIQDDVFTRLLTFPNVLVTGHQGFFTREALERIAETTIANLTAYAEGKPLVHAVTTRQSGRK